MNKYNLSGVFLFEWNENINLGDELICTNIDDTPANLQSIGGTFKYSFIQGNTYIIKDIHYDVDFDMSGVSFEEINNAVFHINYIIKYFKPYKPTICKWDLLIL